MRMCNGCGLKKETCVCDTVDSFMEENSDLMEDLEEMEAQEKGTGTRCLACFFFKCQCKKGLKAKNE